MAITNAPASPLAAGKSHKLKAVLNAETHGPATTDATGLYGKPVNARPARESIVWQVLEERYEDGSAAPKGAIVSLNAATGAVKGLAKGSATLQATAASAPGQSYTGIAVHNKKGTLTATYANSCVVTVAAPAASVQLEQKSFTVYAGGTGAAFTLSATTGPLPGSLSSGQNTLTWSLPVGGTVQFADAGWSLARMAKPCSWPAPPAMGKWPLKAVPWPPGKRQNAK